jgi:alpha-beta hydrolase superfamily lysophospholipase
MILQHCVVEQTVDRAQRVRLLKELVVVRVESRGHELPLAMTRKRLVTESDDPRPTLAPVLLVHGYGQNRHTFHLPARSLPNYLARAGFDVFSLDLRGHGRSRNLGADPPTHVEEFVRDDVPAALREILKLSDNRRIFYLGHSMGGLIGYAVAPRFASHIAGVITLASPFHFTRGSWALSLVGAALLFIDQRVPLGWLSPPLKPVGTTIRALRGFVESPLFPLPIRGFDVGSMEPAVLEQHMQLAMDLGSIAILKNLFFGGFEARKAGHRKGGLTGYAGAFEQLDVPLLVVAGTRDDLAPPASVKPAFDHSQSTDKTYRTFPRGHIDIVVGRDAPLTVWPLVEGWMRNRIEPAGGHYSLGPSL